VQVTATDVESLFYQLILNASLRTWMTWNCYSECEELDHTPGSFVQ